MELHLHYLPEKPVTSCDVITFHVNKWGKLYYVGDNHYSEKFGMFNTYEWSEITEAHYNYQTDIVAWAYLNEAQEELDNEIQR